MPNGKMSQERDVRASKWLGQNHTIQMPFLITLITNRQREINIADHSLTIACDWPLFTLERYYILFSDCLHWCSKQHAIKYLSKFDEETRVHSKLITRPAIVRQFISLNTKMISDTVSVRSCRPLQKKLTTISTQLEYHY